MELLSLSEERLIILLQVMNNFDEINYFFMNNYQNKIELTARNQEPQNEVNFMNDSKGFKMVNRTFPVNQRYFHLYRDPGGMLSRKD